VGVSNGNTGYWQGFLQQQEGGEERERGGKKPTCIKKKGAPKRDPKEKRTGRVGKIRLDSE